MKFFVRLKYFKKKKHDFECFWSCTSKSVLKNTLWWKKLEMFAISIAYEGSLRSNRNVKANIFPLEMCRELFYLIFWVKTFFCFEMEKNALLNLLEHCTVDQLRFLFITLLLHHWGTITRIKGYSKLEEDDRYFVVALGHTDGLPGALSHWDSFYLQAQKQVRAADGAAPNGTYHRWC